MSNDNQDQEWMSCNYPIETEGSRIASKCRSECNHLSHEERERLLKKGLSIINGDKQIDANLQVLREKWDRI